MTDVFNLERKIARLNDLLERASRHYETAFGRSRQCVMGNSFEHKRWAAIKLDEPELADQDDAGRALLPTWPDLSNDLYSALRRTNTVLFDKDQIAPTHRGNRELLAPLVASDDFLHVHDMTMGDDTMTLIAALRFQEGFLAELRRQKEEAEQRREEQEERARQRREERAQRQQQQEEQEDRDDGEDTDADGNQSGEQDALEEGLGDESEGQDADGTWDSQEDAQEGADGPDAGGRGAGTGDGDEPDSEAPESGTEGVDDDGDDPDGAPGADFAGAVSAGGSGPGAEKPTDAAGAADPDLDPEPSNAIEAHEAGRAHANATTVASLALEEAQRLAEAIQGEDGLDEAIAAAEDALQAAQEAVEMADDAEDRLVAQDAYDEMVQAETTLTDLARVALKKAASDLDEQGEMLQLWGIGKADLQQMDPREVMQLMKLLRHSDQLRRIAQLIGNQRVAIQKRKDRTRYTYGPTVRVGAENGRQLSRLFSSQKALMVTVPQVFDQRFVNNRLVQYKTQMEDVQERGTGVLWIDCSGSMWAGHPFRYIEVAKATAISLVEYFQSEGRDCVVGFFDDGVRQLLTVPQGLDAVSLLRIKLQIAQDVYGGGTSFYEPLVAGFTLIAETPYLSKSDQVLITDGQCWLSQDQETDIKQRQDEQRVSVITALMPGGRAEQMKQFGPVFNVRSSLDEAVSLATNIVQQMDDQYDGGTTDEPPIYP